jgi:5,10-methylenetetrahydromethanopterin reductase
MDFGIALASEVDSWRWAKRAEELGFTHVWFYDTQMLCADLFVAMALAAEHTTRIRLGSGVLVPTNRIAPVTANGLASLNALAPGRIDFGVGTGFTARNTMGLPAMRLAALREYLHVVSELLAGRSVQWRADTGEERRIAFLNPEAGLIRLGDPIPIHLSAFAKKARQLAVEVAEGWITFLSVPAMAHWELSEMQASCRAGGRDPATLYTSAFTLGCVLHDGEDAGSARARAQAGPLVTVMFHGLMEGTINASLMPPDLQGALAEYRKVYESYAPADARYLQLHKLHLIDVRPEEERFVTPELIRMGTFTGTAPELRERIAALRDAGFRQLTVQLVHGHETAIEDWAELFATV